jgi:glycosyltransferase involved in cell wall biosynthesis
MKVLLPISLDRWRNPISTLQRACVQYNPDIEFHSFSNPETEEDIQLCKEFWQLPNLHLRKPSAILLDRFDIVHTASYSHGNFASAVMAKVRGIGKTQFLNTMNLEQHPSHKVCWARYARVRTWADGFVAVSEAVAKDMKERMPDRFLGVIPNGFDDVFFDPAIDDQAALPAQMTSLPAHSYALTVSSIEQRKRPDVIIALAKKFPEIPFVWAGLPQLGAEHYVKELESLPNVIWLKGVNKQGIRALLKNAGVFLFPSDREGLPLALAESIGMGLPAIAQPRSSMPELVSDGFNGRLLMAENLEQWGEAMRFYLNRSAGERREMSDRIRAKIRERFTWPAIGRAYGPIYRQLKKS